MSGTVEQGAAAVGLSPTLLSVLCPGLHALLGARSGRSDALALLATRLAYIHGGEPVQGGWWGWVTSMQAAIMRPPKAHRTAAPSQGHSPAVWQLGLLVLL